MGRTKKIGSAGRFGIRHGKKTRTKLAAVESKQRKKQKCPYCNKLGVKRLSSGIWNCEKCNSKFASHAYYLK